jgi:hypothetical protein
MPGGGGWDNKFEFSDQVTYFGQELHFVLTLISMQTLPEECSAWVA